MLFTYGRKTQTCNTIYTSLINIFFKDLILLELDTSKLTIYLWGDVE